MSTRHAWDLHLDRYNLHTPLGLVVWMSLSGCRRLRVRLCCCSYDCDVVLLLQVAFHKQACVARLMLKRVIKHPGAVWWLV